MEKLQKCVNFILTVPVFFATICTFIYYDIWTLLALLTINLTILFYIILKYFVLIKMCSNGERVDIN
jgi:hypothetical protein